MYVTWQCVHNAKVFANSSLNQIQQNNLIPNTLYLSEQNVNEIILNYIIDDHVYSNLRIALKNVSLVQMRRRSYI